jgi:hypothetical protein
MLSSLRIIVFDRRVVDPDIVGCERIADLQRRPFQPHVLK